MKKILTFCFLIATSLYSFSQVVNIENLRSLNDSTTFSGAATLNFNFARDVNKVFALTNDARLLYNFGESSLFFVNNVTFSRLNGQNFNNRNLQHLRYNYRFTEIVALDAFIQLQKNKILFINNRTLYGLGTRFRLHSSKTDHFYLGTLVMYEKENSQGLTGDFIEDAFRGDLYISFNFQPSNRFQFSGTAYYQPKITDFKDYRISLEASININIIKNLFLTTSVSFQEDSFPVFTIPETQLKITNGLSYSF